MLDRMDQMLDQMDPMDHMLDQMDRALSDP